MLPRAVTRLCMAVNIHGGLYSWGERIIHHMGRIMGRIIHHMGRIMGRIIHHMGRIIHHMVVTRVTV